MNANMIERIEATVEHAACVLLAASLAFAGYRVLGDALGQPQLSLAAVCVAASAYLLCSRLLFRPNFDQPHFSVPGFTPAELQAVEPGEPGEPEELVLTADMIRSGSNSNEQEPLVLDDILAELGPDSRVVRLFDPSSMPPPGRLKSRIDDHLGSGHSLGAVPDASRALSEALAELRRSLR